MAKLLKTPIGTARFAHLEVPDQYVDPDTGKKNDPQYKVDLVLPKDDEDVQALIEQLEEVRDEYYDGLPKKKQSKLNLADVFTEEYDDDDEPTGNVIFKFKMNASYEAADGSIVKMNPTRVDSKKRELPKKTRVFGGSKIKVAFKPRAYDGFGQCGVSLRLVAVQVIELAQSSAANVFDEEDGFTADDDDDDVSDGADDDTDDDDEDDDEDMF